MSNISPFKIILIGVFGLAAAIGLFVFATYSGGGGKSAAGPVLVWGTLPRESVESALTTLTQTNTSLKDVTYIEKSPSTIAGELASAIATGASPDLVLASHEELYGLGKFLAPISSDALSADTFSSVFVDGARIFTAPGGYYGIPLLVDPLVLFYNRSILSSSGVARPPATWEALTGLVPSVARLTPTRQISRGLIALGTYSNVHNARGILSSLFLQTGVPVSGYTQTGVLVADLGVQGQSGTPPGQAVVNFYTQFADPSKISYTWNAALPDSQQAFVVGDLALYIGYASEAQYLHEANPNLNFGVTAIPQPGTAAGKNAYGLFYSLMISRGAKNSAGAYQVASILSNQAEQSVLAGTTGLTPANLGALEAPPASDPVAGVAYDAALYSHGWLSPGSANTDAVFSGMIANVISGRVTLEAALSSAQSALSALLSQ